MKTCTKCGETKELGEFTHTKQRGKPYIMPSCKECMKDYNKQYKSLNQDKVKVAHAEWMRKHPGYGARWRKDNPDKTAKYQHDYNINNPDKVREKRSRHTKKRLDQYGSDTLGALRSANAYFEKHGTMEGWVYTGYGKKGRFDERVIESSEHSGPAVRRSASVYFRKHGTLVGWTYRPRKRHSK